MTDKQLNKLSRHIVEILGGTFRWLPYVRFDYPDKYGTPFIKINDNGYHWIVNIDDNHVIIRSTNDTGKILYWIANYISFTIAFDFIQKKRKLSLLNRLLKKNYPELNERPAIWKKQLELIRKIDSNYESLCKEDIDKVLKNYPFEEWDI
ncbi:MAG: immunity 63 family protein [Planctomycetaceae bacterium]|nr:immunity 63 family protein [Planctomycetaceae bacterium]